MQRGKKKLLAVLLCLVLLFGCGAQQAPGVSMSENYYPEQPHFSTRPSAFCWNEDGGLTVQSANRLLRLSAENELLEEISLNTAQLPENYALCWNDERILALAQEGENQAFAAVCLTGQGEVFLMNLSLFGRQGKLVRRYSEGAVYGYDPSGEYQLLAVTPSGEPAVAYSALTETQRIFWLNDDQAIFNCQSRIVLYDFAADSGRVLDEMSGWMEELGERWVYYGADAAQSGVLDGIYYYLVRRDPQGQSAAIWCADETGARQLAQGPFSLLFVGRSALIAATMTDTEGPEWQVERVDPGSGAVTSIWKGLLEPDFRESGRITFCTGPAAKQNMLLSYDPETGVLDSFSFGQVRPEQFFSYSAQGELFLCYSRYDGSVLTDWVCQVGKDPVRLPDGTLQRIAALRPDGQRVAEYQTEDQLALRVALPPQPEQE